MSKTAVVEEPQAPPRVATCRHHWLIETPRGATSKGRCKRCGSEREFRNSADGYLWEDDSSKGYNTWSGVPSSPKLIDDDEVVGAALRSAGSGSVLVV